MKKLSAKRLLAGLLLVVVWTNVDGQAQSDTKWTEEKATVWYDSQTWLNDLPAKPSEVIDKQEFARQYHANKAGWDKAFTFLKNTDFTKLRIGKYPIDDENVFAIVSEGPPREISNSKWEAHNVYNDIHFMIKGKEKIGITPLANAPVAEAYNSSRDIGFFTIDTGKFYVAEPGMFFIVTTKDAHNPGNKVEGYGGVKKVVVKVKTVP